jgi:TrpR-related protein YerC/YecD
MRNVSQHDIDELYAAILSLKNLGEAKSFFRDLLTEGEIKEFAERWKVAAMLARKVPYTSIIDETGLSSRTVARVARWVNRGMGGYRLVLKRKRVLRD